MISTKLVEMDKIVECFTSIKDLLTEKTHSSPSGTEMLAILKRFVVVLSYESTNRLHMHIAFVQKIREKAGCADILNRNGQPGVN